MAHNRSDGETWREPSVIDIVVSSGHDYWVKKDEPALQHGARVVRRAELVAGRGIRGDRYFGKPANHKGQITFITLDAIEQIRRRFALPDLPVAVFRRNVIVSGMQLLDLIGTRFSIQGVEFEGVQECKPCRWMDRMVADGAQEFMRAEFRGGLRARILRDGVLECTGDAHEP